MRRKTKARVQHSVRIPMAEKPTIFSLLTHIVSSAFTGGMLLILAFGGAIVTYLYYNHVTTEHLPVLLLGIVIVSAFFRGCYAWQQDLNEYHRYKSGIRHHQK